MFQIIEEYMKKSREERMAHLRLDEECIKIGGYDSREYRGLLAHYLKTEIPTGKKVCLCHACNYHWCSNPRHFYWGTHSDNIKDRRECGSLPISARQKPTPISEIREGIATKLKYLETIDRFTFGWIERAAKHLSVTHTNVRRLCDENGLDRIKRKSPTK